MALSIRIHLRLASRMTPSCSSVESIKKLARIGQGCRLVLQVNSGVPLCGVQICGVRRQLLVISVLYLLVLLLASSLFSAISRKADKQT
jgi:hypothetical protein